jgi:starch synthase
MVMIRGEVIASRLCDHNMGYHGHFAAKCWRAGISRTAFQSGWIEFHGDVNWGSVGRFRLLTTVSPRYAQEIQTPEFGYGLDGVAGSRGTA